MNMRPDLSRAKALEEERAEVAEGFPLHDARVLTAGGAQARIVLDGQVYALRITRAGKLILTK
jgi:hemin uptake protein HemP